jgi:hypothetical protein
VLYPTAQIERIYQNEKVEKLQKRPSKSENNCELVSAKKKNFENNYSQGRSRMGMPLRYYYIASYNQLKLLETDETNVSVHLRL